MKRTGSSHCAECHRAVQQETHAFCFYFSGQRFAVENVNKNADALKMVTTQSKAFVFGSLILCNPCFHLLDSNTKQAGNEVPAI